MQLITREVFFLTGGKKAERGLDKFIAIVLLCVATTAGMASAKTITVGSSQSIQSVINASTTVSGDIVVVPASIRNESITLNKSITVQAQGAVTLRPGGYTGVSINSSNCAVIGFRLENFERAVQPDTSRSNVLLQDLTFRNAGAGIWVQGDRWTVERVDMEFRCRSGEDYINAFGSNHIFRRLFLWGLHIPEDIGPRSDGTYKHSDLIQCWTAGGTAGIQNTIVEECIFTDYAEGVYFHNETGMQDGINGNIVRNNVFWGTDFPSEPGTNLVGGPVHTTRFTGPSSNPGSIRNNLYFNEVLGVTADGVTGVNVEGNIIYGSGSAYAVQNMAVSGINRGTLGNLLWNNNYNGGVSGAPDRTSINPQLQNPNAVGAAVLGPDGIPWTADDAWRPMNASAAAYGPQITTTPSPNQILSELRDLFPTLDANQDGYLTILESLVTSAVFAVADVNNDGRLTIVELLQATVGPVGVNSPVYVRFTYAGVEDGTVSRPFNTLYEAANFVAPGGEVTIGASLVGEPVQITGPMTLTRDN